MSDSTLAKQILETLNSFRQNPMSIQKSIQVNSKAFIKAKKNQEGKALEDFAKTINNLTALDQFTKSKGLSKAADEVLKKILRLKKLDPSAPEQLLSSSKTFLKEINSVDEILVDADNENLISQIIATSSRDNNNIAKLIDNSHKFAGIAAKETGDSIYTVILLSDTLVEIEEEDFGEDAELKEAFDLFDIYSTGKLDQVALHDAFKALGFEKDSYSVFSVINSFNTNNKVIKQGGVDWETFKDAVKSLIGDFDSKEGIRKLFELFVDDPNQDTITSDTLKKVAADLNDDLSNKELKEIMKRAAHNGVDIDFEEFYKIMCDYKELHPEEAQTS